MNLKELNDPRAWRHLIKDACGSCGKELSYKHREERYSTNGNFCTTCCARASSSMKKATMGLEY